MKVIETTRLILRTWESNDLDDFFLLNQDPRVVEYLMPMSSKEFIKNMNHQFQVSQYTLFAVDEKESGKLIGFTGLNSPKWHTSFTPCVEIGWRLRADYWQQGYATEAATAVLDYGFKLCGLKEILAWTVPENIRSIRVMQKIGMEHVISGNFNHPGVPKGHRLASHILYRIKCNPS